MRAGSCRLQVRGRPPCPRRPAELPMLTVSGRRPWLAALPAAHARSRRTHEAQRSPRSPGPTEAGWGTGEPRRQGWRRKEAERKGWGEEREGGREEGELILSPPLGPLSEVAMEKGSRWHSPRRAEDPYAGGKASARTSPLPPPRQASGPQRPGWDRPDPVGQMAAPGHQEGSGEGQEPRGLRTGLTASIALHEGPEGRGKARDAVSRLGDPRPWGCVSHLRLPPLL